MLVSDLIWRGQAWQVWLHRVTPGPSDDFELRFLRGASGSTTVSVIIDESAYRALITDDAVSRRAKLLPVLQRALSSAQGEASLGEPSSSSSPELRRLSAPTLLALGRAPAVRVHTVVRAAHYSMSELDAAALPVVGRDPCQCVGIVRKRALASECLASLHDSDSCVVLNHLERQVALVTERECVEEGSLLGATYPLVVVDRQRVPLRVVLPENAERRHGPP